MSGFASPYEEDNPFADMQGTGRVTQSPERTQDKVTQDAATEDTLTDPTPAGQTQAEDETKDEDVDDTPRKIRQSSAHTSAAASPTREQKTSTAGRRAGGRRSIRAAALTKRLQNIDLESDPLGPLGGVTSPQDDADDVYTPVTTTMTATNATAQPASTTGGAQGQKSEGRDEGGSARPPQSVPLSQAANPTFQIVVGDPVKIGDITSAHTVYKVSTRTTSQAFRAGEFSVTRRYRDFLWLYDQLNRNCPGAIVPPPPDKQAVGRFQDDFVEQRRFSLERMLEKIARHPLLRNDADFKLFLESETFSSDIKHRPVDSRQAHEQNKGFLGLGSAFSFAGRFVEPDDFFENRRAGFENLEAQLIGMARAMHAVMRQRNELAQTTSDFGAALSSLSTVELSRSLSNALGNLSDLQIKIKELHERQAQQDFLTFGHMIEEYVRVIGSVKAALAARQRLWSTWQAAESECAKRKAASDKLKRGARTQGDRLSQAAGDLADAETKANGLRADFEQSSKLLRQEMARFDAEKVEDFKASVEMFLESAVEAQKEVIEHWEFFNELLARELDDDDGVVGLDQAETASAHVEQSQEHDSTLEHGVEHGDEGHIEQQQQQQQQRPAHLQQTATSSAAEDTATEAPSSAGLPPPSAASTAGETASSGFASQSPALRPRPAGVISLPAEEANPFATSA